MAVTLPFVLLLLDFWPLQRFQLKTKNLKLKTFLPLLRKSPLFLLSLMDTCITAQVQRGAMTGLNILPASTRVFNMLFSYSPVSRQDFLAGQTCRCLPLQLVFAGRGSRLVAAVANCIIRPWLGAGDTACRGSSPVGFGSWAPWFRPLGSFRWGYKLMPTATPTFRPSASSCWWSGLWPSSPGPERRPTAAPEPSRLLGQTNLRSRTLGRLEAGPSALGYCAPLACSAWPCWSFSHP